MIKTEGRKLGRMIRKMTGLQLPVAMKIGKRIVQGQTCTILDKFSDVVKSEWQHCGDGCCSWPTYTITGPKGQVGTEYSLSKESVQKEHDMFVFFKEHPGGTYTHKVK